MGYQGSPPLTRGIQLWQVLVAHGLGFTPAHAGNTRKIILMCCLEWVHPRSRGEYYSSYIFKNMLVGSPPLTRGIQNLHLARLDQPGFTPAHAGNTQRLFYQSRSKSGSPPLTRGIRDKYDPNTPKVGFTPAHAGNTIRKSKKNVWQRVHPRSRGEYQFRRSWTDTRSGSPPLTRGIRHFHLHDRVHKRFTPAHAGNTENGVFTGSDMKVHPRSRGEYILWKLPAYLAMGSPPLTRGIQDLFLQLGSRIRFTPAHAGNTMMRQRMHLQIWVHPRSRGEYKSRRTLSTE